MKGEIRKTALCQNEPNFDASEPNAGAQRII